MEDLEDKITKIAKEYPDFAKGWIQKRLHQEVDSTGQLPDKDTIRNIRDCLASLDEKSKTIQKLYKISFTGMNTIQEKWHKELAKKAEKLKEFGGKPFEYEPILKCDNGFQWVRLNTPEAKDYEGNAMGHCVGSGGYDNNKTIIYSLRDKDNIPHITVEFDERRNKIEQIQGKGNTEPNKKYYDDILKLYKILGVTDYYSLVRNNSYAIANGKIFIGDKDILACPLDTVFDYVRLTENSKIKEWNYSVSGNFYANLGISLSSLKKWHNNICDTYGSNLEYVNPNCKFGGNVNIGMAPIKEWHCDVGGNFDARMSNLEYINPDCKFGGDVDISYTRNLKEWHNDVPRWFQAECSRLEYVNPDCKFGGYVNISKTPIKEWHCDVGSDFNAGYSNLEYVNPDCKFGGNVDISDTQIKEWHCDVPGNFKAKGFSRLEKIINCEIKGEIYCRNNVEIINEEKQVMRM